ncbi:MAG TPA: protein kinase [Gemmatimonadaceae bacterium]|nr:protein kinase [Gemmatimonadaceae bacterium]
MSDIGARLAAALADRYRLERPLGEGGMALVYVAEDVRHHRKVAVKVLRPELCESLGHERFLREIEIVAGLRHPHILPLYDSGEAGGFLYYVMPLVEGETLRGRIDRERQLPIDDALRFAREVADALSYAHARGVVHRDIKPENILIDGDHAVIADFGIAKAVAAAGHGAALTRTGMTIGTPAYMSPEQAAGDADLDGRSDLYSLACVLYEMLAGTPPFTGATTESLVRQHMVAPPPPVTQFRPAVPAVVSDALMRALAKSPADRFNPVGQFSAALAQPTHASPVASTMPTHPRRPARRLVAAGIGLVVVAAGIAWAIATRDRPPGGAAGARSVAVLPFDNLSGDTSVVPLLLGVHAEMVTQLTKIGGLKVASRTSALEYRNTTKSDRDIASELGVVTLLRGTIQRSGDQVRFSVALADVPQGKELWAESYDRAYTAANLFEVQGDIARAVASALRVQLSPQQQQQIARAPTTNLSALDAYYRGLLSWTDRSSGETDTLTVHHLERAVELDTSFVAAWSLLAQARSWLIRRGLETDTLWAWAAVQHTQQLAPGSLEAVVAQGNYRYYARGDIASALEDLSNAQRLMPNSSEIIYVVSLLERRLGRWNDAVAHARRALELDPRNGLIMFTLGETYTLMRRFDEAQRMLARARELMPESQQAHLQTIVLHIAMGDTAGARSALRQASAVLPERIQRGFSAQLALLGRNYPLASSDLAMQTPEFRNTYPHRSIQLALVAAARGDSALARVHADTLLRSGTDELEARKLRGGVDPFGRRSLIEAQMAVAMTIRGEREAGIRLAEGAAGQFSMSRDAIDGASPRQYLAWTYMLAGRRADAIATLESLLAVPSAVTVPLLRLDPTYDSLRGEPAFQRLVGR